MANGVDRFDEMPNDRKTDLLRRSANTLRDGKMLLYHWQKTTDACDDCRKLKDEIAPFIAGINNMLKELGVG